MQRPLRFLMLNWRDPENPAAGGAERVSLGYLAALADRGHEVWWYANAFKDAATETLLHGVRIRRGGSMGTSIYHAWRWYARQPSFDLVIDQHHGIPWLAPWWTQTRCVAYIHEVLGPIWSAFYPAPIAQLGQLQEWLTHLIYRNIPFWTACQGTERMLSSRGIRQIKRIPYGVHTRSLPKLPDKTYQEPLKLITVSRLAPNKRIQHAIQTLARLKDLGIAASLDIVGRGDEEPFLRQLVQEQRLGDVVHFKGNLSESAKDRALAQAHLLLHTSIREGWGLNVIEANAMGTPSVVYPVAGLVESTLHGLTGRVAKMESPEALTEEVIHFLNHPADYQACRQNAWKQAKQFHWDEILPRACDWLEFMAKQKSSST